MSDTHLPIHHLSHYYDHHDIASGCEILSPDHMRQVERDAVAGGYVGSSFDLMQKAGQSVADYIKLHYPDHISVFFIGPGNNGGDGVVAYHALKRAGKSVFSILSTSVDNYKGDARKSFDLGDSSDFVCVDNYVDNDIHAVIDQRCENRPILLVDAIFGIGYRLFQGDRSQNPNRLIQILRQCQENYAPKYTCVPSARAEIDYKDCCVLAIDVPSGIEASTGRVTQNACVEADITLTFFRKKMGHCLQPSRQFCGEVIVIDDLGMPSHLLEKSGFLALENDPKIWFSDYPQPVDDSHKYDFGQVGLFGGKDMCGAASLAAQACMRVGAGLCTLQAFPGRGDLYRQILPPHIMVREDDHNIAKPNHVRAIGFGLGAPHRAVDKVVDKILAACIAAAQQNHGAYVFDAQILQAGRIEKLNLDQSYASNYILTPHWGEFLRIGHAFGCDYAAMDKWDAVQDFTLKSPAILVLKGSDTIIAKRGRIPIINTHTSPVLASAGTGDVLAGMVAGLAARFMRPLLHDALSGEEQSACKQNLLFMASAMAVWMHGEAAQRIGPGLVASDLLLEIPHVLKGLLFKNEKK